MNASQREAKKKREKVGKMSIAKKKFKWQLPTLDFPKQFQLGLHFQAKKLPV